LHAAAVNYGQLLKLAQIGLDNTRVIDENVTVRHDASLDGVKFGQSFFEAPRLNHERKGIAATFANDATKSGGGGGIGRPAGTTGNEGRLASFDLL
jgi:hypothetical protein